MGNSSSKSGMAALAGRSLRWRFTAGVSAGDEFLVSFDEAGRLAWTGLAGRPKGRVGGSPEATSQAVSSEVMLVAWIEAGHAIVLALDMSRGVMTGLASDAKTQFPISGDFSVVGSSSSAE